MFYSSSSSASKQKFRFRVDKPYRLYPSQGEFNDSTISSVNNWAPLYTFGTRDLATNYYFHDTAFSVLDDIFVVPNPYYAVSEYEENRLDNVVKIVNIPQKCTIRIYSLNGTLVRTYLKDDPLTSLDWDLKKQNNIPIASGAYYIHIKAHQLLSSNKHLKKGANERILKWVGIVRSPSLSGF